jgi:hypothetical protein
MNRAELQAWAEAHDAALVARDFRYGVLVLDREGCLLLWQHAELVEQAEGWVVVFTEHHGFHVFHRDEIVQLEPLTRPDRAERLQLQQTGIDIVRRSRARQERHETDAG